MRRSGAKMLLVADEGRLDVIAAGRTPTWTQLSAVAARGATQITLLTDVNWRVGDEVVVASSDYGTKDHAANERRRITAIAGRTLTLDRPLTYWHYGAASETVRHGMPIDVRAEVGVLASNVMFEGDMSAQSASSPSETPWYTPEQLRYGGHLIQVDRSFVRINGIAVRHFGQAGRLGRYAMHVHFVGEYGAHQYWTNNMVFDSFSRCMVIHATSHFRAQGNVCYNVNGHAIYMEIGTEQNCEVRE